MARFRAQPYAQALHEVVLQQCPERADAVSAELARLAEALVRLPQLQRVLVVPTVVEETKAAILVEVLDLLEITEPTRRFAHVLRQHYRTQHLGDIAAAYQRRVDRAAGRTRARIEVASELDSEGRTAIVNALGEHLGVDVIAEFVSNPELLGGFRARVASKVFDGSLAGQLDQLRRRTETRQR